ncbi:sodium:solute symporter [Gaopeijia maritima]|uniref:sodium:solute symporter n=1 Tax=Gaopeijia maritima TaxID=3119007 RepID=UPI003246AC44
MSEGLPALDLGVLLVYLLGVTVWGAWLGRGQTGGRDYFLGNRDLPWWAVMLSVVATETSTLTFLSIPGISYLGTLAFLQVTFGYLLGRVVVAGVLLPSYHRGELTTAYELLERRFGVGTRRLTSVIFMITRLLADSVRLFATAIPLALLTGWSYPVAVAVIGLLTVIYTYFGGIRAVVWVDVAQMLLYLFGAVVAAVVLQSVVAGGWSQIFATAGAAGKLQVFDLSLDLGVAYTLPAGLLGGAFLSMGSHGADQLTVQRLLTCRSLRDSQRALVGSGVLVIVQFAIFLVVGLGLWVFYQGRAFDASDEIFARFIVDELPAGLTGLLVAGVLAAAMSSLSSSINALASASAYDLWAPLAGARDDDAGILRAGRVFTLVWSVLLVGGALVFLRIGEGAAAVEVALGVSSMVYGGLLGAFALALFSERADARSVAVGIVVGIGFVTWIWATRRSALAWPWFVLVGTLLATATGWLLGGRRGRPTD